MVLSGGICIDERSYGTNRRFFAGCGSVTIWPAAHESGSITWTPQQTNGEVSEIISIQIESSALSGRFASLDDRAIAMHPALVDPALSALIRLVEADVERGCPTGRLYGEALSLAIATRVASLYAARGSAPKPTRNQLSTRQRACVTERIQSNLDGNLSLGELASLVAMSPQHFAEAFRNTFGTTPHQHVLRARIDHAMRLLMTRETSIAEIALSVGFASQSHFTSTFRQLTGVTPRRFRVEA